MKTQIPTMNTNVFQDNKDGENFKILLNTLNHVQPVYISREEYMNLHGSILKVTGTDKIGEFYDLYLPQDLRIGELLNLIAFLTTQFNIKKYAKIEKIISKTKVMIELITRNMSEVESKEYRDRLILENNLDEHFVNRIMAQKILFSHAKEIFTDIKSSRSKNIPQKIGTKEDLENGEVILSNLYSREFDLIFFKKGMNMLRLGMMTMTSGELPNIRKKQGIIHINVLTKNLDKHERLLRDKIGIDALKKELQEVRKIGNKKVIQSVEKKAVNKIMFVLYEYPYQATEENIGYKPSKIFQSKEIYCTGYCLLGHALLSELGIQHYGLTLYQHTALEVVIGEKRFYFDVCAGDELLEFKKIQDVGIMEKIYIKELEIDIFCILKNNPEQTLLAHICSNLGTEFSNQEKHEEAIKMFKKSLEFNPKDSNNWRYLANSLFNLGKYKQAIPYLEKAIQLHPEEQDNYNNYGVTLAQLKKYKEAIIMYDRAIQIDKKFPDSYINKSISLYKLEKYNESILMCDRALKLSPEASDAFNNKGLALIGLKRYSEALIAFNKAISIEPNDSYVYYNKGLAYEELGNKFLEKLYKFSSDVLDGKINNKKKSVEKEKIIQIVHSKDYHGLRLYLLSFEKK